jgi:ferredoxin
MYMSIKKVWVEDTCTACGLCEEICPEVFKVNGMSSVKKGVNFDQHEDAIKEAAETCPVEAIKFE